ncbi:putative C5 methylase MarMP [Mycoplasma phage MAV1]|uniref:Bacteriophage MAV1 putative C5 methylase MarMP n=1 Tax=Metamycoplasma arthritidis (strain 158L3-1) TaxID=243272 RepID=B3PNA7_META1|nr:DNA methyltransferase [Metamycoplasma arthritidis]NP_047260.1 DNA methyltransferase [Mycoplasma phage MAV1]AAC33770.1 putative C5 methylase MarMP [Mycoplasma phage MAV1]ACF07509.1 bacteriophage MAV1 putative C5 methylase MarMP [Metamycoplasma arthritidis 158L3-1]
MNKTIVWALYDDAESSYMKTIKKHFDNEFEVHSIGINYIEFPKAKNYFYHRIDLSILNDNLIQELNKLPKPDIILASPPCESWSIADCGGRMFMGFDQTGNFIVKNKAFYDEYNEKCHPNKKRYFFQKERSRIAGEATIAATVQIIKFFNPLVWVIENPSTSKSWEFQEKHLGFKAYNMNLTYYSSYDESYSLKPTIFKSNIKLNLLQKIRTGNKNHMARGSYSKRSSIPENLVKEIINQIKSIVLETKKAGSKKLKNG